MSYRLIFQPRSPELQQSSREAAKRLLLGRAAIEKFWPQGLPSRKNFRHGSVTLWDQKDRDYRYQLCMRGDGWMM